MSSKMSKTFCSAYWCSVSREQDTIMNCEQVKVKLSADFQRNI